MADSSPIRIYAVWCKHSLPPLDVCRFLTLYLHATGETTTPEGDFKISRKGIYASAEDAQIGLKFALKGGHYAHMIFEGKDITPEFKGTLRVCNVTEYYDAVDDDPARLYIWAKDLKGEWRA